MINVGENLAISRNCGGILRITANYQQSQ